MFICRTNIQDEMELVEVEFHGKNSVQAKHVI